MTTQETVFNFLKDSILELKDLDESAVFFDAELGALGLDSLDFVEVQVMTKRRFGVQVNPAALADGSIKTLGEFSRHVVTLTATA